MDITYIHTLYTHTDIINADIMYIYMNISICSIYISNSIIRLSHGDGKPCQVWELPRASSAVKSLASGPEKKMESASLGGLK